jgi:tetratricopeptide (TPR) repeat protein
MKRSTKIAWIVSVASLMTLLFVACVSFVAVSIMQIQRAAAAAKAAINARDYDQTIVQLTRIISNPLAFDAQAFALRDRGMVYTYKWQFDNAITDFDLALRLNSRLPYAHSLRAIAYQRKGQTDQAIVDLGEEIARDPNFGPAHYYRGMLLYKIKQDARLALLDFDEALRCDPRKDEAAILRGDCYAEMGDFDRALASFDAAVMLNWTNPRAFFERSELYRRKGEKEKSRADLEESRRLTKQQSATVANQTVTPTSILEQQARLELSVLPPAKPQPGFEQAAQLLGKTDSAWRNSDFDGAIDAANRVLAMNISPEQASFAVMRRGTAHSSKSEVDAALADFDQAIRLNPKNAWAYIDRAIALDDKGNSGAALRDLDEAVRLDPHDALAFHNRATIRLKRKEYDAALKDFAQELELNPQDSDAHAGRAAAFRRQNKNAKALEECNLAITRNPNSFMAHMERVKAYAALKRYDDAGKDLETIAHLDVKWPGAASNSVASIHATHPDPKMRDAPRAVAEAMRACELSEWKQWTFIATLAAACAEAGDFESAVKFQEQALSMAPPQHELVPQAKKRLELYRHRKPYQEE